MKKKILYYEAMFLITGCVACTSKTLLDAKINSLNSNTKNMVNSLFSSEIQKNIIISEQHEEIMKKIPYLEVDIKNTDLSCLDFFCNATKLRINSSELLTQEQIEQINNSSIQKVYLEFNLDNLDNVKYNKLDLTTLTKECSIEVSRSFYEIEILTLLSFINNLDNLSFENIGNVEKYLTANKKVDEALELCNIKEKDKDKIKIAKIAYYILNHLQYDNIVRNETDGYEELSKKYNNEVISSVMDNPDALNVDSVCINYASLLDLMLYKVNIKSDIISGTKEINTPGHAWNDIYIKDQKYMLDLTNADFDEMISWIYLYIFFNEQYSINDDDMFEYLDYSSMYDEYYSSYILDEEVPLSNSISKKNNYSLSIIYGLLMGDLSLIILSLSDLLLGEEVEDKKRFK